MESQKAAHRSRHFLGFEYILSDACNPGTAPAGGQRSNGEDHGSGEKNGG